MSPSLVIYKERRGETVRRRGKTKKNMVDNEESCVYKNQETSASGSACERPSLSHDSGPNGDNVFDNAGKADCDCGTVQQR